MYNTIYTYYCNSSYYCLFTYVLIDYIKQKYIENSIFKYTLKLISHNKTVNKYLKLNGWQINNCNFPTTPQTR